MTTPISVPSREFMVRQAVLNACEAEYPGVKSAGQYLRWRFGCFIDNPEVVAGSSLIALVKDEYRALASRYEVAA